MRHDAGVQSFRCEGVRSRRYPLISFPGSLFLITTIAIGALLATRVPLASALEQAGSAAGDAAIARRLDDARERVLTGETLSRALSLSEAVPPSAIQLIRAGEATGDVSAMLIYSAKLDRERVQTELRALVRFVEPVMILAFGGLVALVAASLLQAVYAVRPVP